MKMIPFSCDGTVCWEEVSEPGSPPSDGVSPSLFPSVF